MLLEELNGWARVVLRGEYYDTLESIIWCDYGNYFPPSSATHCDNWDLNLKETWHEEKVYEFQTSLNMKFSSQETGKIFKFPAFEVDEKCKHLPYFKHFNYITLE